MPAWEFVWHDGPASGSSFHLPCIDERAVKFRLNQPGSAELRVPLNTDPGRHIALGDGWGYVLGYRDGVLRGVWETAASDVGPASSEGVPSIALTGVQSAFERVAGVILSAKPVVFPSSAGSAGTAFNNLFSANPSYGISAGFLHSTPSVNPSSFDAGINLLELIQAFAFRGSGFDFGFEPHFVPGSPPTVGIWRAGSSWSSGANVAAMEYGNNTRANLKSYSWKRLGGEHLANVALVPPSGTSADNAAGVATAIDLTSFVKYGSRARWLGADFDEIGLRQSLADDHVLYRKNPRRVLSITPNMTGPNPGDAQPLSSYGLGSVVPVVIRDQGMTVISGTVRVYGIDITIDKNGAENVELATIPE